MSVQAADTGRDIIENVTADLKTLRGRIASHGTIDEWGREQFLLRDIRNVKHIDEALAALAKAEW